MSSDQVRDPLFQPRTSRQVAFLPLSIDPQTARTVACITTVFAIVSALFAAVGAPLPVVVAPAAACAFTLVIAFLDGRRRIDVADDVWTKPMGGHF